MIRLPILSVGAAVVVALDRAHWVRLLARHWPAYRRGSVTSPTMCLNGRICAWPATEAQSDSVVSPADVTSHEQTTRKRTGNLKDEPRSETGGSNVLHTGRYGGAASRSQRRRSDSSAVADCRQALLLRPSIIARERLVTRAVKAASRAQRGRSETKEARSALSARVASRTITARRPLITTRIGTPAMSPRRCVRRRTAPAEAETAWRERPPRWPQAWQARRSKMVVAHATVLRLTASPTAARVAGGTRRRPMRMFSNPQR